MDNCIFCQIVAGKIPSEKVYEDDDLFAFKDIHPAAPTHVLVIPKKHIPSLMELKEEDERLAGKILLGVQKVARKLGLQEKGFRVVNNMGEEGGQTVYHIHFHLLGGRHLTWPPG
ncbi:histidine triad nucleotide-binding protein [Paenactinomyces guangxiensis]|uniref:Histidine triad nucleotide-binding protein n=1 Tax=Paenactinomyces guangxiensis TaxID=1490290 RepID=A0A7W1WNJ6_9BACL|nr:histidine triad nucleotide-binding protein [Paenactinomyces guangxiensis]MBA4493147.1 histidine triad nucleotide-binding protein [Paenactinomyces guangxiensis]MBH8590003.1 histidine triad nucleotide-binding protein [Paenactinomyces guangxiensis]